MLLSDLIPGLVLVICTTEFSVFLNISGSDILGEDDARLPVVLTLFLSSGLTSCG